MVLFPSVPIIGILFMAGCLLPRSEFHGVATAWHVHTRIHAALIMAYCILSQIQWLMQTRRFLSPLAYTDAQLLNAHAFVFLASPLCVMRFAQRIDLQTLFAARPDCAFWFTFRSWF